jgi:DNA adenine methylase
MEEVAVRASSVPLARYPSPLRYPGGKGRVANFLKLLLINNSLVGIDYLEPYAGGASVALTLLFEEYIGHAHINDLNAGVFSFWQFLLRRPDQLCSRISSVSLTIDEWQRQKAILKDPSSEPDQVGFATFFLNRTNRSGIIARGGVIGGNRQEGAWKIDARFNRTALIARIGKISRFSPRITVTQRDAAQLLRSEARRKTPRFLYLDPPYYVKGAYLYDNSYRHGDHLAISRSIQNLRSPWVVSYDAAPEILEMYEECASLRYVLGYSASTASRGAEVMFFSPGMEIPDVISPTSVSSSMIEGRLRSISALS